MKIIKLKPAKQSLSAINSASSLKNVNEQIFVCCDDQYDLYELDNKNWIQHPWADAPRLPKNHAARKKLKPDFEAILGPINNNLLIIPSGSKKNRNQGLMFDLETNYFVTLDLSDFFKALSLKVKKINIEGAEINGLNILFLNRGVGKNKSSIIKVVADNFKIISIHKLNFGSIKDVELHGSELCIFENHLYALAVAENTSNSYDDGLIMGSALFKLSLESFDILDSWVFDRQIKTEGLCRYKNQWLVATDPDGVSCSEFFVFEI